MWHDPDVNSPIELRAEQLLNALRHCMSVLDRDQELAPDFPNPHPSQSREQVFTQRDRLRDDYQTRRIEARKGALADANAILDELTDRVNATPTKVR